MSPDHFNPNVNTASSIDFIPDTIDAADGQWSRQELPLGFNSGPYYRVAAGDWDPSREREEGRWAGTEKPKSKEEAHDMYFLPHLNQSLPWKLYTFHILPNRSVWLFKSKVKGGSGRQVKLPNPVCEFIVIDQEEIWP
jgi:hypothetical protein